MSPSFLLQLFHWIISYFKLYWNSWRIPWPFYWFFTDHLLIINTVHKQEDCEFVLDFIKAILVLKVTKVKGVPLLIPFFFSSQTWDHGNMVLETKACTACLCKTKNILKACMGFYRYQLSVFLFLKINRREKNFTEKKINKNFVKLCRFI